MLTAITLFAFSGLGTFITFFFIVIAVLFPFFLIAVVTNGFVAACSAAARLAAFVLLIGGIVILAYGASPPEPSAPKDHLASVLQDYAEHPDSPR